MSDARGKRGPIRVLVTGPDIAQSGGAGIQQHVRYLMKAFVSDSAFELRPFAITSVVREEAWLLKGVRLLWKYLQLLFVVPSIDVVHVNSSLDDRSIVRDSGVLFITAMFRRASVVQFHGGDASNLRVVGKGLLFRGARWGLRHAREVLFLSPEQGEPVSALFGLDSRRVRYVANYVPVDEYEFRPAPAGVGLRVVYVGRLHSDKGVLQAIEAFGRVAGSSWSLRVAGAGPQQAAVESAAAKTQGASFAGFVEGDAKRELLASADVFVLPSAHFEGMPYGALEALASGLALVASANAGLARLVRDGWNGVVVPPLDVDAIASAFTRLASDRASLETMRANSRSLALEQYSLVRGHEVFAETYATAALRGDGR